MQCQSKVVIVRRTIVVLVFYLTLYHVSTCISIREWFLSIELQVICGLCVQEVDEGDIIGRSSSCDSGTVYECLIPLFVYEHRCIECVVEGPRERRAHVLINEGHVIGRVVVIHSYIDVCIVGGVQVEGVS